MLKSIKMYLWVLLAVSFTLIIVSACEKATPQVVEITKQVPVTVVVTQLVEVVITATPQQTNYLWPEYLPQGYSVIRQSVKANEMGFLMNILVPTPPGRVGGFPNDVALAGGAFYCENHRQLSFDPKWFSR
jgi:hypothetical protein